MTRSSHKSGERAGAGSGPMLPIENETARGLSFAHVMVMAIDQQNRETAAVARALARLLIDRGLIGEEEWGKEVERPAQPGYCSDSA